MRRFQSAHDLAFVLGSVHEAPGGLRDDLRIRGAPRRKRLAWVLPGAGVGIALGLAIGIGVARWMSPAPDRSLARFTLTVPQASAVNRNAGDITISPDGRIVALVASDSNSVQQLWTRPMGSLAARRVKGTEGAYLPFWSPDSRQIAFFANGKLLKVPADGGPVVDICPAPSGRGGTWNRSDVIVFAPASAGPLHRVSANGGEPSPVTALDSTRRETGHRFPHFLPDGRHFTFVSIPARQGNYDVFVGSLGSRESRLLMTSAAAPVFSPPHWLVFSRAGQLMAQRFDPSRRRLAGEPATLGVASGFSTYDSEPAASASLTGALAFPSDSLQDTEVVWYDLQGRRLGTVPMPAGHYEGLRISPDGSRVAIERRNSVSSADIWVAELARGVATRFIFEPGRNLSPTWNPKGDGIVYSSNRAGPQDLYLRMLHGSGLDEELPKSSPLFKVPQEWSSDGRFLIVQAFNLETSWDLMSLDMGGDRRLAPLLQGLANEGPGALSPNGRWLAYVSDQSGNPQFYVQSFPRTGDRYQLSERGTFNNVTVPSPVWLRGGSQIAFMGPDGSTLMVADVIPGPTFRATTPRTLFRLPPGVLGLSTNPGGTRLLATVPSRGEPVGAVALVVHWARQLER